MNKKGFTLIELLAVIVILAIIALIATPIIIGIIKDAKDKSDKRSIDLYGNTIKNAVAAYQVNNPNNKIVGTNYTSTTLEAIEGLNISYEGSRVNCNKISIYEDGNIYLSNCTVNGKEVDYTYGVKQAEQVFKPQYYGLTGYRDASQGLPEGVSNVPPEGKTYYLGFDSEDGTTIDVGYLCFKRNGKEYCIIRDAEAYETNIEILNEAFADTEDSCHYSWDNSSYNCNDYLVTAYSNGMVSAYSNYPCSIFDYAFHFVCNG